jgi:hypothetical protein
MSMMMRCAGLTLVACLMGGAVSASEVPDAKPAPAPDAFAQAMAARGVAEFARRQKDPEAFILAARMLQELPFHDAAGVPQDSTPDGAAAAFTPRGLYAEAKVLAKGNQALLMQISVAESTGSRGVTSSGFGAGLLRTVQPIGPRGAYAFSLKAKAGELLRVGAIGDLNTRMVLKMVDAKGKTVCNADSGDYAPVCSFKPQGAADFKVQLVNRSDNPTRAVILSN